MKKTVAVISMAVALLSGCAGANVSSAKWDSGLTGANLVTRCERVDMRDSSGMNGVFTKYDGWKMVYVSEYTTGNKVGTDGVVCFERQKS